MGFRAIAERSEVQAKTYDLLAKSRDLLRRVELLERR
jgi:hypothetical protein